MLHERGIDLCTVFCFVLFCFSDWQTEADVVLNHPKNSVKEVKCLFIHHFAEAWLNVAR